MSLAGLRVLVTRPAHQAEGLCQLLEQAGAQVQRLPLLAIEPAGDPVQQRRLLQEARDFDGWIFTSRNAVDYAVALDEGPWPTLYAIGGATAEALRLAGHANVRTPERGSTSEALLERPELQAVQGQRFLLVTGENGRETLRQRLRDRGAEVRSVELYRRVPLRYEPSEVEAAVLGSDAIVVTSSEALDQLWARMPAPTLPLLLDKRMVLPSHRVVEKAAALGFLRTCVPDAVSDAALLRCLENPPPPPPDPALDLAPEAGTPPEPAKAGSRPAPEEPPAPPAPPQPILSDADAIPRRASASGASWKSQPEPDAPGRSRAWSLLAWLLVLGLLAALAYTGWWAWEQRRTQLALLEQHHTALAQLQRRASELEAQAAQLGTRQSDLSRIAQRNGTELAAIQSRIEESDQLMGRISEELQGGRTRFILAAVEHLLVLANDKLLLDRDAPTALRALEVADQRLAALNDPRYFAIRQALAEERAALMALPRTDIASVALSLSSLTGRVSSLPLKASIPETRPDRLPRLRDASGENTVERLWSSVRQALSSVFVVRRDDNARSLRLLPPEQEAVIYHVLTLKLEAARVALLRGETAAYRESCRSAVVWLQDQFKAEDPGVMATVAELERLQNQDLRPALPDISRSLTLLRAQVEAP